jgi:hypothetical protein
MNISEKKIMNIVRNGESTSLTLEDGQEIRWETSALSTFPMHATLRLRLVHPETEAEERSVLAATILNELLTPSALPQHP